MYQVIFDLTPKSGIRIEGVLISNINNYNRKSTWYNKLMIK